MVTAMVSRVLLALAVAAAVVVRAEAQSTMSPAVRAAWGFDRSDLPPHPAVRFGVLPNGLRYALMRNAVPAGGLAMRLRVDVGATVEAEREQGFVHMIEHLLFEGSRTLPAGALPLFLQRDGLAHWSDFNAFTSFDETVYRLDLARADARARTTALTLADETLRGLIFTRATVGGARKRIGEEIRSRDGVQDRILAAQHAFFLPGTPLDRGPVAGTRASIRRADPATLRRLWDLYYAPDRTTLVLVGDFDPEVVETEIAARFADWRPRAQAGAPASQHAGGLPVARGLEARLFVDPDAPTRISIASVSPPDGARDSGAARDVQFLELLGSRMLNRRFADLGIEAEMSIYTYYGMARLAELEVSAPDRDWRRALAAGGRELRRALEEGFTQAELDAQFAASRPMLADRAAVDSSSGLADAIVDAVGRNLVFTRPADDGATLDYLGRVRLDAVNAAFRAAWSGGGRLIFVSHHRRLKGGEKAVLEAWEEEEEEEEEGGG